MSRPRDPQIRVVVDNCRQCGAEDVEVYAMLQGKRVGGRGGVCLKCCTERTVAYQQEQNAASIKTARNYAVPWSADDMNHLKFMYESGFSVPEIAQHLGRTAYSVRTKLCKEKIKRPSDDAAPYPQGA